MPLGQLVMDDRLWAADFLGRPALPVDALATPAEALAGLDAQGARPLFLRLQPPYSAELAGLLQTLLLRPLPASLVLIADAVNDDPSVRRLEAAGAAAYLWPRDRARLRQLWAEATKPAPSPTAADLLERRLRCWTPSLLPQAERLALAAAHDVTVLLTGETGTGKTYLAKMLHELSPRRSERFLTVACGAVAPGLIESEFFGHVKGAFTGADRAKLGKFAAAGAGTLLLDEIDALGLEQQANLLRIIESGAFEPVGSSDTQQIRCRVIVASNRDLAQEVAAGRFRDDLYWRLNVMHFHLAPLRERPEDLPWLIRGLTARFALKFKKPLREIAPATLALLTGQAWPGNLRQLENALQAAVLVSRGETLEPRDCPEALRQPEAAILPFPARPAGDTLSRNRETAERNVILSALSKHGQSRVEAARSLGISRVTLYKKMKKYGLFSPPAGTLAAQA